MERHGVTSFCRRVNKKRRSEISYFKTAVRLLYFVLAHECIYRTESPVCTEY